MMTKVVRDIIRKTSLFNGCPFSATCIGQVPRCQVRSTVSQVERLGGCSRRQSFMPGQLPLLSPADRLSGRGKLDDRRLAIDREVGRSRICPLVAFCAGCRCVCLFFLPFSLLGSVFTEELLSIIKKCSCVSVISPIRYTSPILLPGSRRPQTPHRPSRWHPISNTK
jgi:hypothetical protein